MRTLELVDRRGRVRRLCLVVAFLLPFSGALRVEAQRDPLPADATLRSWVEEMKEAPRGPFDSIRWFCEDGTIRGAKQGCGGAGGGIQHGRWTERARILRDNGFLIANVMAEVDPQALVGIEGRSALEQILLERFLVEADDGWVLRAARSYRGALQAEDEDAGTQRLLAAMLDDATWRSAQNFFLLREAGRYLPRQPVPGDVSASDVRNVASWIARKDSGFRELRVKIHSQPDSGDAERVRLYAAGSAKESVGNGYETLAGKIDRLYLGGEAAADVEHLAGLLPEGDFRAGLVRDAQALAVARDPEQRLSLTSRLLTRLRLHAGRFEGPEKGLALLDTSLSLEDATYAAGNELLKRVPYATRRQRLGWLREVIGSLYGTGLLSARQSAAFQQSLRDIEKSPELATYREEVAYLARAPEWAARRLRFEMGGTVAHFRRIDPKADLYLQDRLRGSPFLFYAAIVDSLAADAGNLAGVSHLLFGAKVATGLRGLNPGLARGVLRAGKGLSVSDFAPDGIYLVPETTSELPPVAGILTEGEGSSLSHVQLLARNLGIPNIVVSDQRAAALRSRLGESVVVAVSPGGVVRVEVDGTAWDAVFRGEAEDSEMAPGSTRIVPDRDKLRLDKLDLVTLDDLRSSDSGKTVGPKSANLGELRRYFGERVPNGVVVPFGVFRRVLDEPIDMDGPAAFVWMKRQYDVLPYLADDPALQKKTTADLLARIRDFIALANFPPGFESALRTSLRETFGPDGTYGVFVRSDTNVEDLPGFTGAGLNRTVANVVGEDEIIAAIREVWASPFSQRAYSWRQAHMDDPEWVFPAVLIQKAFPSEKSGVMVTKDVAGGRPGYVTIAVSEGVGGVVDGQAAESLLVREVDGHTRLLGEAAQWERRELNPTGGLDLKPAQRSLRLLDPSEVSALLTLAREAREDFPALEGDEGEAVPADIEFGINGQSLALLQIRPFVESREAVTSEFLVGLDAGSRGRGEVRIDLDAVPGGPGFLPPVVSPTGD